MTVALVSSRNQQATGVDRYVDALAKGLPAAGVPVDLVDLRRRELRVGSLRVGGLLSIRWQRMTKRLKGYDLVHALDPSVATPGTDVVTVHDIIPETHPQWGSPGLASRADWALSRRNTTRARRIIAISHATRAEILRHWRVPDEQVVVVTQGIDLDLFRPRGGGSPLLAEDKPTLVYVGDDNPRKNVALVVHALADLRDRHGIDARFLRIGPTRYPDLAARYRAFARERGLDVVEPGFVSDDEVVRCYTSASCFVWPSYVEGFGAPPVEAMACGAPVVALDAPVTREIVGPLGRYHDDSPAACADAIAATLRAPPPKDELMAWAARYSWDRTVEGTLAVYEALRSGR